MINLQSEKQFRILIVHNHYRIPGGEDTVVENEKKMLTEKGHIVVSYTRNNVEIDHFSFIHKILLPFIILFSLKTYKDVKQLIKDNSIDIVHVHNTLLLISPSVYYAAFRCRVEVIQTLHNFRMICPGALLYRNGGMCQDCIQQGLKCSVKHKCYRNSRIQTLMSALILNLHRMLGTYKKIDYICLTELNKRKLLEGKGKKYFPESKIYIKPNFVENDRPPVPYKDRKRQFVFVGRPEAVKGIHILLEAWKGITEYQLLICGDSNEMDWCRNYIQEKQLNNVILLGRMPNKEIKGILAESLALIFPTQCYEGFPVSIIESFSCGTPVIGSALGNTKNIITDGKTGLLFLHSSPDDLKEKVYELSDMTEECYRVYKEKYSKNVNYNCLLDIYQKVKKTGRHVQ